MLRKLMTLAAAAALATGFMSASAFAQSAKFAATWDNGTVTTSVSSTCTTTWDAIGEVWVTVCTGLADKTDVEVEMATIHVATYKSVLIGVSSQIGIHLITEAKGKSGGGDSSAVAEGSVDVQLSLVDPDSGAVCDIAPSDTVILKSEMRKLEVKATSTDSDISVFVGIDTKSISANSFNFLAVECEQGNYKLTATFTNEAMAEAFGLDSLADVTVTLGQRMITMQEVRAVKGSLVEDPS